LIRCAQRGGDDDGRASYVPGMTRLLRSVMFHRFLAASWMAMIFGLSSQSRLPAQALFSGQDKWEHGLAYALLSWLLAGAFALRGALPPARATAALLLTVFYGVGDEWHQSFVSGRTADVGDVIADTAGALFTAACLWRRPALHPALYRTAAAPAGAWRRVLILLVALLALGRTAAGDPVAAPGDLRLRHDLQLLADSGLLNIPLTAWPLPWGDVSNALAPEEKVQDAAVHAAWRRVHARMEREFSEGLRLTTRLATAASPVRFRTFTTTPRSTVEAGTTLALMGDDWALHLEGTAVVRKPRDGRRWRLDGTYAALALGNWILSAGWQDRWWGPGWDGSLIMSTNPRPIPTIAISRNASDPFDLPALQWLGAWRFTFFQGLLEGDRFVPHALLTGIRLSLKPTPKLEFGLARAMQWGGSGRPRTLATFIRALIGSDNTGKLGVNAANQPGNQLADLDVRWRSPYGDLPYALYAQFTGEDASSRAPIAYLGLFGLEVWGGFGDAGASWRLHSEFAYTTANLFSGTWNRLGTAYEHGVYRSGYRYYKRSIGHSIDGDGRQLSLGLTVVDAGGGTWEALLRGIEVNEDNANPGPVKIPAEHIMSLQLRTIQEFRIGRLTAGFGIDRSKPYGGSDHNVAIHTELQWESTF